jgi:hypothetical protein
MPFGSHGIWVQPDVFGLFSESVGSFSNNLGFSTSIFSRNVGRKRQIPPDLVVKMPSR